jgi:hypothetical protein
VTEKLEAKSQLIEKTAFAVLPILFTCVVYLMSSLDKLNHDVTVLNAKSRPNSRQSRENHHSRGKG